MKKIYVGNLSLIVTEKCNLNCAHCLRGEARNNEITNEVIDTTLSQIKFINTLTISGGEVTLALDKIIEIINVIIKNEIIVRNIAFVTNGVVYNKEFIQILNWIDSKLKKPKFGNTYTALYVSHDKYHIEDVVSKNLFLEYMVNINSYEADKHFVNYNSPNNLLREGKAESFDKSLTIPFIPTKLFMSYLVAYKKFLKTHLALDLEYGNCFINEIAISTGGLITDSNASFEHMETIYNYGSVFENSIEDICLSRKPKIIGPEKLSDYQRSYLKKYL